MDKRKKTLTAEEQLEVDLQLEADLGKVQRQQKILDRERTAYTSGAKFAKQRKLINVLSHENDNVLTDLFVATCDTKKKSDGLLNSNMRNLLNDFDNFDALAYEKKSNLKGLDYQIGKIRKRITDLKSKLPTDVDHQNRMLVGQKTLESLENKLDTVIQSFCTISTNNSVLREEIEHMFYERIHFKKQWEDLIVNLSTGKSFMMDLIEQSTIAYDQREEWCARLQALRSRAHGDLIVQTNDMQAMQRKLDHDRKSVEFLGVKSQKRVMIQLEIKKAAKHQERREELNRKLREYKQTLAEILEFTGSATIDGITKEFIKLEELNLSMFNHINVIHKEIENTTGDLVKLHVNLDDDHDVDEARGKEQYDKLNHYKIELHTAKQNADTAEATKKRTEVTLKKVYEGIMKLFKICKCSNAPIVELLGENIAITDYNVELYLTLLEKTICDLLMMVYVKEKTIKRGKTEPIIRDKYEPEVIYLIQDIVCTTPCPLCVEHAMVSDVIDSLQFVQSKYGVSDKLGQRLLIPGELEKLHNVSACHLPESRQILQRRYQ